MPRLKKISNFPIQNEDSFKIIFLAEAYNTKKTFIDDCLISLDYIKNVYPFNLIRITHLLEVYYYFEPSESATILSNPSETYLRSWLEEEQWRFNAEIVSEKLEDLELYWDGKNEKLYHFLNKGTSYNKIKKTLVCILSPDAVFNQKQEMIHEQVPNDNSHYFIATSTHNKHWPQIVIRSIGKILGLGDEFSSNSDLEIGTDSFDEVDAYYANRLTPNLYYTKKKITEITKEEVKWRHLLGINLNHNDVENPNSYESLGYIYSDQGVSLIEGGGGFKTHVFRASHDCLMKVNFNLDYSNIFKIPIPFCSVCSDYLITVMKQILDERDDSSFSFRQNLLIQ